jgi:hypothetical protein
MRDLQAATPKQLRLLVSVPGSYREERGLHRRFKSERLNGEWFKGNGAVRAFVESLLAMNDDERVVAIASAGEPQKSKSRRKVSAWRGLTPKEFADLFIVGDSADIYRSARAEEILSEYDADRRAYGLPPKGLL